MLRAVPNSICPFEVDGRSVSVSKMCYCCSACCAKRMQPSCTRFDCAARSARPCALQLATFSLQPCTLQPCSQQPAARNRGFCCLQPRNLQHVKGSAALTGRLAGRYRGGDLMQTKPGRRQSRVQGTRPPARIDAGGTQGNHLTLAMRRQFCSTCLCSVNS
jgi:hypothetical protein